MRRSLLVLGLLCLTLTPRPAWAVKVADITRPAGSRTNDVTGMGLVFGLNGTGDGGAFLPAIRPLAALLKRFANSSTPLDLSNANNVAVVMVKATLPKDGVRQGDHLDVHVLTIGGSKSLRGGTLYLTPLLTPTGEAYVPLDAAGNRLEAIPFALGSGPIELDDASVPTSGTVRGGATMEVDLPATYVDKMGLFTLVIDGPAASWQMASTIAKLINESADTGQTVAVAADPRNVVIQIPAAERDRPDAFIANVLRLDVPIVAGEARVRINTRAGTISGDRDIEISPFVVSQKGITITSSSDPAPATAAATSGRRGGTQRGTVAGDGGGAGVVRLHDLMEVFDQLKVPADDRIQIVKQLRQDGKLHAKLWIDDVEQ